MKIICAKCGHDANMHDGDWDCAGCMSDHCNCARSCREVREQPKDEANKPKESA